MKGYLIMSRLICFTEYFQAKLTKDGIYTSPLDDKMVNVVSAIKPPQTFTTLKYRSIMFYSPHSVSCAVFIILKSLY